MERTTWDGLPVSDDPPYGATVAVWRSGGGRRQWLLLHRAHHGPEYEGDWAWTPPSGARLPGETLAACARRELIEETGLELHCSPTPCGTADWAVYSAEAPVDAGVVVDAEHDRFAWVELDDALALCRPAAVADGLRAVGRWVDVESSVGG